MLGDDENIFRQLFLGFRIPVVKVRMGDNDPFHTLIGILNAYRQFNERESQLAVVCILKTGISIFLPSIGSIRNVLPAISILPVALRIC